jgi:hypothetical protein
MRSELESIRQQQTQHQLFLGNGIRSIGSNFRTNVKAIRVDPVWAGYLGFWQRLSGVPVGNHDQVTQGDVRRFEAISREAMPTNPGMRNVRLDRCDFKGWGAGEHANSPSQKQRTCG